MPKQHCQAWIVGGYAIEHLQQTCVEERRRGHGVGERYDEQQPGDRSILGQIGVRVHFGNCIRRSQTRVIEM
jgi:hypothetical protein